LLFSLLCTMAMRRRIAAASSTDVPPNFIATTSSRCSNLLCRGSPVILISPFFRNLAQRKTHRQIASGGGFGELALKVLYLIRSRPPEDT
jgi:hypothetical protein